MTRFCPPHWTVAVALALAGAVATGCDGGPTWNETDPAVGPEAPNVVTGTIGPDGGIVEGPGKALVGAPSGSASEELEVAIEVVDPSEIPVAIPEEMPVSPVEDRYYRLVPGEPVLQKPEDPLVLGGTLESIAEGNAILATLRPVEGVIPDTIEENEDQKYWNFNSMGDINEKGDMADLLHYVPESGLVFTFLKSEVGDNSKTNKDKSRNDNIKYNCKRYTFDGLSNPCEKFERDWNSSIKSYLEKSFEELESQGWEGPRLDKSRVDLGNVLSGGNILEDKYVIDVSGNHAQRGPDAIPVVGSVQPPAKYRPTTQSITIYYEESNGDARGEEYVRETLAQELTHAFQAAEIVNTAVDQLNREALGNNLWMIEGVGKLSEESVDGGVIERQGVIDKPKTIVREVSPPLVVQGESKEYRTQDFWYYATRKNDQDFSILQEIHDRIGNQINDTNPGGRVVFKDITDSVFRESIGRGLEEIYWNWVKWQFYEGDIPQTFAGKEACESHFSGLDSYQVNKSPKDIDLDPMEHLSSAPLKLNPQWDATARRDVSITAGREDRTNLDEPQGLRMKAYVEGRSNCGRSENEGLTPDLEDVRGDESIYVVLSNVSGEEQSRVGLSVVTALPPPTKLVAQSRDAATALNWEPPKDPPSSFRDRYNVYRSTSEFEDPSEATPVDGGIGETSFTDTGLENGQTYYYRVTANYEAEEGTNFFESDPTSQVEVKPLPEPPDRP